jgi:hypothetical protein
MRIGGSIPFTRSQSSSRADRRTFTLQNNGRFTHAVTHRKRQFAFVRSCLFIRQALRRYETLPRPCYSKPRRP